MDVSWEFISNPLEVGTKSYERDLVVSEIIITQNQ